MSENVGACRSTSELVGRMSYRCRRNVGKCWSHVGVMSYVGEISEVLRNLGLTMSLFSVFLGWLYGVSVLASVTMDVMGRPAWARPG
jgi:hypothetical protein